MVTSGDYRAKKRINEMLRAYWDALRGARPFPEEEEIDAEDIAPIWPSCFLAQRGAKTDGTPSFTYAYLGSSLIEAYGDDLSDKEICEKLAYPANASIAHKFHDVVATRAPVEEEGEFVNANRVRVKYRSTLLPLGDGRGGVGSILGGMKWKAY